MYIFNPEDCFELYSIHNRNVGVSLIEINEGMNELLDKHVDTENENKNSGVHTSPCKVCNENKSRRKKRLLCKNFFTERRTL